MSKNSFILHLDSLEILDELSGDQCKELLIAMRGYNSGKEVKLSGLMKALFVSFKNQFDRDNEKYLKICDRNKGNGAKGGRPKKNPTEPKKPTGIFKNPTEPKKPDNDNDSDSDNDSDINTVYSFDDFWNDYDKKTDRRKCEIKYKKIKESDREKIKQTIRAYVKSKPESQYRKNPLSYLNGECWNDEIKAPQLAITDQPRKTMKKL